VRSPDPATAVYVADRRAAAGTASAGLYAGHIMGTTPRQIPRFSGTPREVGRAVGRALGPRLEDNIARYLRDRPQPREALDVAELRRGALPWLRTLPLRFQDELEGLAEGAHLPLQRVAEWNYVESCLDEGCSAFVGRIGEHVWIARNNDMYVPGVWGHAIVRELTGRIPTLCFGAEGSVFTATGLNRDRLWLHHHALSTSDAPRDGRRHMHGWVLLTDMLETCSTILEVEGRLSDVDRDEGMILFAVDGKSDEFAIFECSSSRYVRRQQTAPWMVGTNHACVLAAPEPGGDSRARQLRLEAMAGELYDRQLQLRLPQDLISILADEGVERREASLSTVYSAVACPHDGRLWFTFGGYPAASQGRWEAVAWPE
jgi:hypothetical protein